jgi:uncharacterized Zn finger protein
MRNFFELLGAPCDGCGRSPDKSKPEEWTFTFCNGGAIVHCEECGEAERKRERAEGVTSLEVEP